MADILSQEEIDALLSTVSYYGDTDEPISDEEFQRRTAEYEKQKLFDKYFNGMDYREAEAILKEHKPEYFI